MMDDNAMKSTAAEPAEETATEPADVAAETKTEAQAKETAANSESPSDASTDRPPSVAEGGTPVEGSALSKEELDKLQQDIIAALKTVYDPEIPVDIYELGLIYSIDVDDNRNVTIEMTLTAPGCPVAGDMPQWVHDAVVMVEGVSSVEVKMVFMPPWDPSRMSEEARVALNMF